MTEVDPRRVTADFEGEVVVFLVGMRCNKLWAVHRWLPVFRAAARMRRELDDPDGLLGSRTVLGWRTITIVQYWDSTEALHEYAHDGNKEHRPAWQAFNAEIAETEAVGIWHETYRVENTDHESVYRNMPPYGLGAACGRVPATGDRETMRGRLGE